MTHTFDWIEIRTHDIQATADFYEALFGWKIIQKTQSEGSALWIFDTGDEPRLENLRRGGLWLRPQGEVLGIGVYIVVDDVDATLQRVIELGGKPASPKVRAGSGYAADFTDPSGNLLGLYEDGKD